MKRCVIICGADINNYDKCRSYLSDNDYYIFCDSGLNHASPLGITPDLIIGDFDSHPLPDTDTEIIQLPTEKDDTDSIYAVKEAIQRGFSHFLFLGVIGNRLDHSLGNIYMLFILKEHGVTGEILDDYSLISLISPDSPAYIEDKYPYFSILNVSGTAKGIIIKNAKYTLSGEDIHTSFQYGISNEPLSGQTAQVSLEEGYLLLLKIF